MGSMPTDEEMDTEIRLVLRNGAVYAAMLAAIAAWLWWLW